MPTALSEMYARGKQVPGGACGFWGACGAGISTGMYMSIVTKSTPLASKAWGLSNQMTGQALIAIGNNAKLISDIPEPDIVITMGCNVYCPKIPCKERYDWGLDDPTGKSDEEFIKTANKIKERILELRR